MKLRASLGLAAAVALFAAAAPVHAGVLNPGDFDSSLTGAYSVAGETFITTRTQTYATVVNIPNFGNVDFDFSLTTDVYSNPGTGGYDFLYKLTNTAPVATGDSFERITLSSFASYSVDADYQTGTGLVSPTEVDRSPGLGTVVGYNFFASPINPTQTAQYLIVRTNATNYTMGDATVIDSANGSVVVDVPFGTTASPEPSSIAILAASMGLLARRRRSVK